MNSLESEDWKGRQKIQGKFVPFAREEKGVTRVCAGTAFMGEGAVRHGLVNRVSNADNVFIFLEALECRFNWSFVTSRHVGVSLDSGCTVLKSKSFRLVPLF